MGYNVMGGIFLSVLCCNIVASQEPVAQYDQTRTTTTVGKPHHHTHQHSDACNNKDNDKEVAEKAIATLASMATSILNIGADAHNPAAIGTSVINILSSFINFVTFALKNPGIVELLNDELFQDALRSSIIRNLPEKDEEICNEEPA